jgi:hypothetical protein
MQLAIIHRIGKSTFHGYVSNEHYIDLLIGNG